MRNNDVTAQDESGAIASGAVSGGLAAGPYGAIAGAAAPVLGGIIGNLLGGNSASQANDQRNAALAEYLGISVPDVEKMKLNLDHQQVVGRVDPQLQALFQQGPSAYENINVDPRLRSQQMAALESIGGIAKNGLSQADAASFELAKRDASSYDQAKQSQILQELQQRGQGGSGNELIARLKSDQSGADRLQQADLEQSRLQQQARLAALSQQGNLSGQLRQQDFSDAANKAQASDAISRFNTQSQQNENQANVGIANTAQVSNLQNQQRVSDNNVGLNNQQQIYNKGLQQQNYQNQLNLANARANVRTGNANSLDQRASQTAGMYAGIGQGIGTGVTNYINGQNTQNQQNFNNNLNQQYMDSLTKQKAQTYDNNSFDPNNPNGKNIT